jgi:hypothetical protein
MATELPRIALIHPALEVSPATEGKPLSGLPGGAASAAGGVQMMHIDPIVQHPIFRNPGLGGLFWAQPKPRSGFSLPTLISPTATPNDQTLFQEPQPGGPLHYLPAFKLATTGSGNQQHYATSLSVTATGYLLTVTLADATSLSLLSSGKHEMPVTLYMVTATVAGTATSWDLTTVTVNGTSITLSLAISDITTRDAIYAAMTTQAMQTKLILRRSPALALPLPLAASAPGQPPSQQLYRQSPIAIDTAIEFYFDPTLDQSVFAGLPIGSGAVPTTLNTATIPYPADGAKSYPYWQNPLEPDAFYFLPDSYNIARLVTSPHTPAITVTTSGDDPDTMQLTLTFLAKPVWDGKRIDAAKSGGLQTAFDVPEVSSLTILPATNTQLLLNLPPVDPTASSTLSPVTNATIDTANCIQGSVTMGLPQFKQIYGALFVSPSILLSGEVDITIDAANAMQRVLFSGGAANFCGDVLDTSMSYDPTAGTVTVVATNAIESPVHVVSSPVGIENKSGAIATSVVSVSCSMPVDLAAVTAASAASTGNGATASTPATAQGTPTAPAPTTSITTVLQLPSGQSVDSSTSVVLDSSQFQVQPDINAIWSAIVQNQVVAPVKKQISLQLAASVFPPQSASVTSTGQATSGTSSTDSTTPSGSGSSSASTNPPQPAATTTTAPDDSSAGSASSTATPASSSASTPTAPALLAVQVVFQNGQTVTFEPTMTATGGFYTQTLGLSVPIDDYVLGQGDSSTYTYRVDTITVSGSQYGAWQTDNVDMLFVSLSN